MDKINNDLKIDDIYKISRDLILAKDRSIIDDCLSNEYQIKKSFTSITDNDINESE